MKKYIFEKTYLIIVNFILGYLLITEKEVGLSIIKFCYIVLLLVYTIEAFEYIDFSKLTIENVYNKLFKK